MASSADVGQRVLENVVFKERNLLLAQNQLLTQRLQHASRDIERLKAKLSQNNELATHLQNRSIHSVGELEALHGESLSLQKQNADLRAELASVHKKSERTETDCKFLELRIVEAKRELDDFRARERQWAVEKQEWRKQADSLNDADVLNNTLKAQLQIETDTIVQLQEQNETLIQERRGLASRVSELQQTLEAEKAKLREFKVTMTEDSEQVVMAMKEYHEEMQEGLRRQLEDERTMVTARMKGKEELNDQLEAKCSRLLAETEQLKRSLRALKDEVRQAHEHNRDISGEAELLLRQKCKLESHLSVVSGNEAQLRGLLDAKSLEGATESDVALELSTRSIWPSVTASRGQSNADAEAGYTEIALAKQHAGEKQRAVHESVGKLGALLQRLRESAGAKAWENLRGNLLLQSHKELASAIGECFSKCNDSHQSHGQVAIKFHRCRVELQAVRAENESLLGQRVDALQKLKHFADVYDAMLKKSRTQRKMDKQKDAAHEIESRRAAARIAELEAQGRMLTDQALELASSSNAEQSASAAQLSNCQAENRELRRQAEQHLEELEKLRIGAEDEKTWKQKYASLSQQHIRNETRLRDALSEVRALIEADVLKQNQIDSLRRDYENLSRTIEEVASQD